MLKQVFGDPRSLDSCTETSGLQGYRDLDAWGGHLRLCYLGRTLLTYVGGREESFEVQRIADEVFSS